MVLTDNAVGAGGGGWTDGRTDGQMNGRADGWTGRWMDNSEKYK